MEVRLTVLAEISLLMFVDKIDEFESMETVAAPPVPVTVLDRVTAFPVD